MAYVITKLTKAIAAQWIDVVEFIEIENVVAFARLKTELGGLMQKNNGEAAVRAWTSRAGTSGLASCMLTRNSRHPKVRHERRADRRESRSPQEGGGERTTEGPSAMLLPSMSRSGSLRSRARGSHQAPWPKRPSFAGTASRG